MTDKAMETTYSALAARALQKHHTLQIASPNPNSHHRTLIALSGPPGSGKSTLASAVAAHINTQLHLHSHSTSSFSSALVLPMDGFHHPRSYLDSLPNRSEAYARRGAPWTFDAVGVVELVQRLHDARTGGDSESETILAPSFDHALKDPVRDSIAITPDVEIVILEGSWLLLDEEPWCRITGLVDETWFVDVDPEVARDRVATRHLRSGIEREWGEAVRRAEGNDLRNGRLVRQRLVEPAVRVWSVDVARDVEVEDVDVDVEVEDWRMVRPAASGLMVRS